MSKTVAGTTTVFVCSGQQVLSEYTGGTAASSPTQQYIYGEYIDEPILMDTAGTKYYYHRNHLYSVAALTDSAGNVVERYAYDAYGTPTILDASATTILLSSTVDNPCLFTGRRLDEETTLYYYRARYYDTSLGRFIRRDPLGYTDGALLYCVYFIPNSVDPTGTEEVNLWEKEVAVPEKCRKANDGGCSVLQAVDAFVVDDVAGKAWRDYSTQKFDLRRDRETFTVSNVSDIITNLKKLKQCECVYRLTIGPMHGRYHRLDNGTLGNYGGFIIGNEVVEAAPPALVAKKPESAFNNAFDFGLKIRGAMCLDSCVINLAACSENSSTARAIAAATGCRVQRSNGRLFVKTWSRFFGSVVTYQGWSTKGGGIVVVTPWGNRKDRVVTPKGDELWWHHIQ